MNKANFYNITKLQIDFPMFDEIMEKHKDAIENDEDFYKDPETGYMVFTAYCLFKKGFCCGSGCRHCPFRGNKNTGLF